jgi:hypothetical protein
MPAGARSAHRITGRISATRASNASPIPRMLPCRHARHRASLAVDFCSVELGSVADQNCRPRAAVWSSACSQRERRLRWTASAGPPSSDDRLGARCRPSQPGLRLRAGGANRSCLAQCLGACWLSGPYLGHREAMAHEVGLACSSRCHRRTVIRGGVPDAGLSRHIRGGRKVAEHTDR